MIFSLLPLVPMYLVALKEKSAVEIPLICSPVKKFDPSEQALVVGTLGLFSRHEQASTYNW